MAFENGYGEESRLGKSYDLHLFKRLLPFLKPYGRLLIGSILLVVAITLLTLALPLFSKIAIDRYIVPSMATDTQIPAGVNSHQDRRYLTVKSPSPRMQSVIEAHPDLFHLEGDSVRIAYEDLEQLSKPELAVIRHKEMSGLTLVVLVFLIFIGADFGLTFAQRMIMEFAGHRVMHDIRAHLFAHILGQGMPFFTRQPVARLVTRVTNDVQNMHELFTTFVSMVFKDIFLLAGISAVLLALDWRLALAGFAVLPIVIGAAVRFSAKARDIFRAVRVKVAQINTHVNETIDGIKTIQSFVQETNNHDRFSRLNEANYRLGMQEIHVFSLFMPLIEALGFVAVAVILLYGGLHVIDARISLGVLVAAITYMRMFFRPLRDLAENYNVLQNAMASAERIFILLDTREQLPVKETDGDEKDTAADTLSKIELERVSFGYVPGEYVVRDVSFSVAKGETVAVVGPTGAGKTSLLNLILRFYDPAQGRVKVNGKDLRQWHPDRLRAMTAMVPQDPMLFSGTLGDNIFDPFDTVDQATVKRVLNDANCQSLVERQPQGLDTQLIKGGAGLSSGERQLITIARAFARDPQLILLDEATSYIDSHTEAAIHEALHNLTAGRTCVLVAHRLSTARTADRIVVMHHGRVREIGTHDDLIAARGLYWRLYQHDTK